MGLVTFDLDSTLADTRHRHGMIVADGDTDWQAYAMACTEDALVTPVASLWRLLWPAHRVWVVSARSEAARGLTDRWLTRQGLAPDGMLLLPPGGELAEHGYWKASQIRQLASRLGLQHYLHVDDYPPVQAACREFGMECLIVTPPQKLAGFVKDRSYV